MTDEPIVLVDRPKPGVGRILLNRQRKRNAISHEMVDLIEQAMAEFAAEGVAVVVLTATGDVFSAGADLTEVGGPRPPAAERLQALLVAAEAFVVAVVDGAALGAGISVLTTCPVILASSVAEFVLPERALGVFPAGVVGYLEPWIGTRRALELGLLGGRLPAGEALRLGLVNEVHAPDDLARAVEAWTDALIAEPGVTASAAAVWRSRFATPEFVARKAALDRLQVMPATRRPGGG